MKILLISNNFPPIIDGVGDYTFHLFNHLNKKGITTKVICNNREEIRHFVKYNQLENQVFPIIHKWNLLSCFRIVQLAKRQALNTILIEYVPFSFSKLGIPFFCFFVFIWARLNGLKTAIFFHEVGVRIWGYGIAYFMRGVSQKLLAWLLCLISNSVFTNTKFGNQLLKPFNSIIVPVPSNLLKNFEGVAFEVFNEKIGIVSFLNRCNETLLMALQQLRNADYPNLNLHLIGKAEKNHTSKVNDWLSNMQLTNAVFLVKENNSETLVSTIAKANVYVQLEKLSRGIEGGISTKSGAVMAAMSIGVPIITNFGDMTDKGFFRNNENVYFLEYDSKIDLANAIEKILKDKNYSINLANNSCSTYTNIASWECHVGLIQQKLFS